MKTIKPYYGVSPMSSSSGPKGSSTNPYTQDEFDQMVEAGTWEGGYVEGMGYCMGQVTVTASYPDSSSSGSDDSWPSDDSEDKDDHYPPVPPITGGGGGGSSHGGGGTGGGSTGGGSTGNTLVIGNHPEISTYSRDLLRSLKGNYGRIVITSTFRTPERQVKAMLNNIKKTGVDAQIKLYAAPGDAVIRAYKPNVSDAENLAAMTAEIYRQGPRKVSAHCMTAEEYKTCNVMDISRSQMRNPDQFISEIKSKDENIKYFNEKSNGCIHLEIPQP